MLKILWVVGLLALFGCLGDDPKTNGPGERAEVVPAQSADLPEPRVSTTEALDQVNITVEDISEVRHTVQPRSSDDEASVADKRTRALQASPFYREAPCQDWNGRDVDMSAGVLQGRRQPVRGTDSRPRWDRPGLIRGHRPLFRGVQSIQC